VRGPQGDTIIIYASDDKVRWQPIALETLGSRGVQVIDHSSPKDRLVIIERPLSTGSHWS